MVLGIAVRPTKPAITIVLTVSIETFGKLGENVSAGMLHTTVTLQSLRPVQSEPVGRKTSELAA
jgi:hypothetical protein